MNLKKVIDIFINEQSILKTSKSKPIVDAIKNRNPISFIYIGPRKPKKESVKPGKRIKVEGVAIGLSKRGNLIMRGYVQPPSVSKKGFDKHGWRTFMLSRMSNITVHEDEIFDIKRPKYKEGLDNSMTVTYVTSDWSKKSSLKPTPKTIKPTQRIPQQKQTTQKEPVTPQQKEPTQIPQKEKPDQTTNQPIEKPTATKNELPQIPQKEKPKPVEPEIKPENEPNDDQDNNDDVENNNLQETLNRFKTLIIYN